MIQLTPFIKIKACQPLLKSLYHDSFPPDERRDWHQLMELTNCPNFNLYGIFYCDKFVGLITLWNYPEFTFIEHFAIHKTFQGRGIGSEVLNRLKQSDSSKIILEAEEPTTDLALRRIAFYTRLGFQACEQEYYQPPYSKDKKAVKMLLMSYPEMIYTTEFISIRTRLYIEVYQINDTEVPPLYK